jgi:hypothetical protein
MSVQKPRDRSVDSRTAVLQVGTCSVLNVVTLLFDGAERHGFA